MSYVLFAGKAVTATGDQIDFDEHDDFLFKSLKEINHVYKTLKGINSPVKSTSNPEDVLIAADEAADSITEFIDEAPKSLIPKDIKVLKQALESFRKTKQILWGRLRVGEYNLKKTKLWTFFEKIIVSIQEYLSNRLDRRRYEKAYEVVNDLMTESFDLHVYAYDFITSYHKNIQNIEKKNNKAWELNEKYGLLKLKHLEASLTIEKMSDEEIKEKYKKDPKKVREEIHKINDERTILYGQMIDSFNDVKKEWRKIASRHNDFMKKIRAFETKAIRAFEEELFIILGYRRNFFEIIDDYKIIDIPVDIAEILDEDHLLKDAVYRKEIPAFLAAVNKLFQDLRTDLSIYLEGYSEYHIEDFKAKLERISRYYD